MMTNLPALAAPTEADVAARSRMLTQRLVLGSVVLAALVVIPMAVLGIASWSEMEVSDDPLAGLGIIIAIYFSVPVIVGAFVSALGLVWASKTAGPVVAGVGLGINTVAVLLIAWTWMPAMGL